MVKRINEEELVWNPDYIYRLNGEPFTGIGYELWEDGTLMTEEFYVDGSKVGPSKEWYASGQLEEEVFLVYGGTHGIAREWHENGQLRSEQVAEYGILISEKRWDEQGNLVDEFQISEDHVYYRMLLTSRELHKEEYEKMIERWKEESAK